MKRADMWTDKEIEELRRLLELNWSFGAIGGQIGRTRSATAAQASRLKLRRNPSGGPRVTVPPGERKAPTAPSRSKDLPQSTSRPPPRQKDRPRGDVRVPSHYTTKDGLRIFVWPKDPAAPKPAAVFEKRGIHWVRQDDPSVAFTSKADAARSVHA